jgi:type I restriction enzyme S subunit
LEQFAAGSAQGKLGIYKIKEIEVRLPEIDTQRKIASILSTYDDLIENNLKRIKLLKEKAFLSYKGILRSEKSEKVKLNEVTQVLKRGISPKYVEDDGILVFNQKCIRNHIVSFGDARFTDIEKKISEERLIQKFDTLVNSTGAGTLGRIGMNIQDEITSTVDSHITIVRANCKVTPIFLAQSLLSQESVIENMGEGSTNQTELSPRKLGEEIKISIPKRNVMIEFENQSIPNFNLIWNLQKQNAKLREARDILLPRLMSGEIVV